MTDLLAARLQMALSLGFHIVFAAIGIAMPFFMAVAHWRWLKTSDPVYKKLTKAWAKGVAIFFATGAVSGTALSFELGLLWPEFMFHAGPIIGMPFSWEGAAFFVEAIALGLFLYGWDWLPPRVHWACGLVVGLAGVASGFFVICANGWMNTPVGFDWVGGVATNIDPVRAMFNPSALHQGIHMTLAAFQATGFAVGGLHAFLYLKGKNVELHKRALVIALAFGSLTALIQPLSGDYSAKKVTQQQPLKLAAMENLETTTAKAPFKLGPIEIPGLLSFLAYGDFSATVKGLDAFPKEEHPPVPIVHFFFLLMVGLGMWMAALGAMYLFMLWKKPTFLTDPRVLKAFIWSTPLGFIALEAGWIVTEVGRQPWIIYGVMKTKNAVSQMPGLVYPLILFSLLYLGLSLVVSWLMARQIKALDRNHD